MPPVLLKPLTSLNESEVDALVEILNTDQALRDDLYHGAEIPPITGEEFQQQGMEWQARNQALTYCICTPEPAGTISISHRTADGKARIGYWLTSRKWHQGIGRQAFDQALELAKEMGIWEVSASIEADHPASLRLWQRHRANVEPQDNGRVLVTLRLA